MGHDMALSDRLSTPPKRNTFCSFAEWLKTLPETDRLAAESALADSAWSVIALSRELKLEGCPVSRDSIGIHRRGECRICNGTV